MWAAIAEAVLRCLTPPPSYGAFIRRSGIDADIVVVEGPDHTTRQAATTLGLSDDSRVIKSLVFVVPGHDRADAVPVLVLASGCDRISLWKLGEYCGDVLAGARLATPDEAEAVTGFKTGCIPPLLPRAAPALRVFMDERVLSLPAPVFGGTGRSGHHLRIHPSELQRAARAVVAPLAERRAARSGAATPVAPAVPRAPAALEVLARAAVAAEPPAERSDARLPALPLDPGPQAHPEDAIMVPNEGHSVPGDDPLDVVARLAESGDVRSRPRKVGAEIWRLLRLNAYSLDAEALVEVRRVRRQGRLLAFASVVELGGRTDNGRPPIGQLIAGRQFVAQVGEAHAGTVMRLMRPGAVLSVQGRVQRNPREVDAEQPTTADIIATRLELIREPPSTSTTAAAPASPRQTAAATARSCENAVAGAGAHGPQAAEAAAQRAEELGLPPPTLVDSTSGVHVLCEAISEWCAAPSTVGLDLEWRPRQKGGAAPVLAPTVPVAVMQLADAHTAFVVDLYRLATTREEDASFERVRAAMQRLLSCAGATKLGYACQGDFERLDAALAGCTTGIASVVDLQPLVGRALGLRKGATPGLRHACASLLHVKLDKCQQTSDWESRPLTDAQLVYAALDAAVLLPLYDAARGQQAQAALAAPLAPAAAVDGTSESAVPIPAADEIATGAAGTGAGQGADGSRTQLGPSPASERPLLSRQVALDADTLLRDWLGRPVGARSEVVKLCAALALEPEGAVGRAEPMAGDRADNYHMIEPKWTTAGATHDAADQHEPPAHVVRVVQCGDGGAVTQWANGVCFYVNAGRYRNGPSARYRNRFWWEPSAGGQALRMSWFPGRGHGLRDAAVINLLQSGATRLLLCRRAPSHPYLLCGRLEPVALAHPDGELGRDDDSSALGADGTNGLPVWRTTQAPHVIFELIDAQLLQTSPHSDALNLVLGGREVEQARPEHYDDGEMIGIIT